MSIRRSLLAILTQGPCYGYQLRAEFNRRTGATWPLNVGQVYNTLDRLERDGLVARADTNTEGHVYYEITPLGTADVDDWLSGPVARLAATRDELTIKLAIAVTLPAVDVAHLIHHQRTESTRILNQLTQAARASGEPSTTQDLAGTLVNDALIFAAEAELRWLDQLQSRLTQARADGITDAVPLHVERPKRGRPPRQPVLD